MDKPKDTAIVPASIDRGTMLEKLRVQLTTAPWRKRGKNQPHTPRLSNSGAFTRYSFDHMSIAETAAWLKATFLGQETIETRDLPRWVDMGNPTDMLETYFEHASDRTKMKIASAMLLVFKDVGEHIGDWRGDNAKAFQELMLFTDPALTYRGCPASVVRHAQGVVCEMMELAPLFEPAERLEIIRAIEQLRVVAPNEQWQKWYDICGDWSRYLVFSGMCRNDVSKAFDWLAAVPRSEKDGSFNIMLPSLVADYGIDIVREQCKKLGEDALMQRCLCHLGELPRQQTPLNASRFP